MFMFQIFTNARRFRTRRFNVGVSKTLRVTGTRRNVGGARLFVLGVTGEFGVLF